jgi:hypothetical protein
MFFESYVARPISLPDILITAIMTQQLVYASYLTFILSGILCFDRTFPNVFFVNALFIFESLKCSVTGLTYFHIHAYMNIVFFRFVCLFILPSYCLFFYVFTGLRFCICCYVESEILFHVLSVYCCYSKYVLFLFFRYLIAASLCSVG